MSILVETHKSTSCNLWQTITLIELTLKLYFHRSYSFPSYFQNWKKIYTFWRRSSFNRLRSFWNWFRHWRNVPKNLSQRLSLPVSFWVTVVKGWLPGTYNQQNQQVEAGAKPGSNFQELSIVIGRMYLIFSVLNFQIFSSAFENILHSCNWKNIWINHEKPKTISWDIVPGLIKIYK